MLDRYSEIEDVRAKTRRRVLEDFPRLTFYAEECVRFSYQFNLEMTRYINDNQPYLDDRPELENRTLVVHNLYSRNNQYLDSAYLLILYGHTASPSNLLRSVYEAVLAQYWLSLCTDEGVAEYKERSRPSHKVPSFNDLSQRLYEGKVLDDARREYALLSRYAHPNYLTLANYDTNTMKTVTKLMFTLFLFNTLSYSQLYAHFDVATLDMIGKKTNPFVQEMLHRADYKLATIFPNRPEFSGRLVWPLPAQPNARGA